MIANDRTGSVCSVHTPDYLRTHSPQATGDVYVVSDAELVVEKPSESMDAVVGKDTRSIRSDVPRSGSRSLASVFPSSGVEDTNMLSLRSYVQERQAEIEELSSRRAEYQKLHMDTPLKLCTEKKKTSMLEDEVNRLT